MPNWCENRLTLTGKKEQIKEIYKSMLENRFFDSVIPTPKELLDTTAPNLETLEEMVKKYGYADWYSFRTTEWGTKWEADIDLDRVNLWEGDDKDNLTVIEANFETAWAPPIGVYQELERKGLTVNATYYEPGMGFCGFFESGAQSEQNYTSVSEIPPEIRENFAIDEE